MASRNEEFLKRLIATFRAEAQEHIARISGGLIELGSLTGDARSATIEIIFREAHSLKGAARTVNLPRIEKLCQALEDVFAAAKRNEIALSSDSLDAAHDAVDHIQAILSANPDEQALPSTPGDMEVSRRLEVVLNPESPKARNEARGPGEEPTSPIRQERTPVAEPTKVNESVRVSIERLEGILEEAESLRIGQSGVQALMSRIEATVEEFDLWRRDWAKLHPTIRVLERELGNDGRAAAYGASPRGLATARHESRVGRIFDFLEKNESFITSIEDELRSLLSIAAQTTRSIVSSSELLLNDSIGALMLPVSYLTDALPTFVRRVSREQSKEVVLRLDGTDVELDRRLLQEIKDPITHLLRNCIDHGLETTDERGHVGKEPRGTITLSFAPIGGGKIELLVSDDGRGIDVDGIKEKALSFGLLSEDALSRLNEQEVLRIIFHSGFSTSPIVTDLSGRGLGLAIVLEKVEGIGGKVDVETTPGRGTTFRLELPVAMSTFRGVLVRCRDSVFVVPTIYVERVVAVQRTEIKTMENRPSLLIDGEPVAIVSLPRVLRLPGEGSARSESLAALVIRSAGERIAFEVDEVIDEEELLEKSLGSHLEYVRNIRGAAITLAGKLVPVLNVADLMRSALGDEFAGEIGATEGAREETKRSSVLVVEDSITARSLMKNILEGAGFLVEVAVDGVDGFTKVKEGSFDLVVTDVEMPRMNGFDLTAKIRSDKKLGELPVVLVTALESQQDRERGIEVGANAYIVKSSFENSNLIAIVNRLV